MRVRESKSLLWYGIVFFGLMALACIVWLVQNPVQKIDTNSSGDIATPIIDQLF